jgi:hypothetical protein
MIEVVLSLLPILHLAGSFLAITPLLRIFPKVHRIMSKTIVVVHRTFAASKEGVTQWYELGKDHKNSFVNQVEAAVRSRGDVSSITWRVFRWSGANVHRQRLAAAEALYAEIRALLAASPTDELFLIAHSHGGNMALKALELLWRREPEAESVFEALYARLVSNGFPGRLLRRAS